MAAPTPRLVGPRPEPRDPRAALRSAPLFLTAPVATASMQPRPRLTGIVRARLKYGRHQCWPKNPMTVAGRIEPHAKGDHDDNRAMLDPPDERLDVEAAAARFQAGDQEVWSWLRGFLIHEQEFSARRLSAGDVFPGSLLPKAEALAHTVAEEPDWSVESTWWLDDRALTVHVMCSRSSSGDVWSGLCRAPRPPWMASRASIPGNRHRRKAPCRRDQSPAAKSDRRRISSCAVIGTRSSDEASTAAAQARSVSPSTPS